MCNNWPVKDIQDTSGLVKTLQSLGRNINTRTEQHKREGDVQEGAAPKLKYTRQNREGRGDSVEVRSAGR